jgi:hypothetical protein
MAETDRKGAESSKGQSAEHFTSQHTVTSRIMPPPSSVSIEFHSVQCGCWSLLTGTGFIRNRID